LSWSYKKSGEFQDFLLAITIKYFDISYLVMESNNSYVITPTINWNRVASIAYFFITNYIGRKLLISK